MADIDPIAVAERVLRGRRGAISVTINELQVLANAVLIAAAQLSSQNDGDRE